MLYQARLIACVSVAARGNAALQQKSDSQGGEAALRPHQTQVFHRILYHTS
jgi:hypothetical protein